MYVEVTNQYKGSPYKANIASPPAMLQTLMEYGATVGVAGSKDWLHVCC